MTAEEIAANNSWSLSDDTLLLGVYYRGTTPKPRKILCKKEMRKYFQWHTGKIFKGS